MQVNIPERPRALTDDLLGVISTGCYCDTPVMFTEITTWGTWKYLFSIIHLRLRDSLNTVI